MLASRWFLVLLFAASAGTAEAQTGDPAIVVGAAQVTVSHLTPHHDVAWYSFARESDGYTSVNVARSGLEPADERGVLELELENGVPLKSVWVAVDLQTGRYAASAGNGPFELIAFPLASLTRDPDGKLNRLEDNWDYAEFFVARPRVGGWTGTGGRGGGFEPGEEPHGLRASLADMAPVGASPPPPEELAARDIVVIVEPWHSRFTTTQLVP